MSSLIHIPAINRDKSIDMLMIYPEPGKDSPFQLTPLSILYPGAMFEAQGKRVEYIDLRWDSWDMMEDLMKDSAQIGVSAFTGYQCARAHQVMDRAKQIDPKIITNLGGHHARICTDDVKREPLVDVVWSGKSYGEDLIPFSPAAQRLWKRGDVQMMTSRGCPYACTFCALRDEWNPRDLAQFEQLVDMVYDLTGFQDVSFSDPNIGFEHYKDGDEKKHLNRLDRIAAIGRILGKNGIHWDGNIRADYVTPGLVDVMAKSGCTSIEFGCESGNDHFLRKVIKKGHGVDDIKSANRYMKGSGISVMNSWVRGMPHETHEQWLDTMDLIDWIMEEAPEARASVYRFTPYPGGPAYADAVAGNGIEQFTPPADMKGWGEIRLMADPTYWCAGLCFRLDNTRKNFPGEDWALIEPYVLEACRLWKERRPEDFEHVAEVERLIAVQIDKHNATPGNCT